MITKAGKRVLTQNTKKMDRLNKEMKGLALELVDMDTLFVDDPRRNSQGDPSFFHELMLQARRNRAEHVQLQEEINLVINLEWWLKT